MEDHGFNHGFKVIVVFVCFLFCFVLFVSEVLHIVATFCLELWRLSECRCHDAWWNCTLLPDQLIFLFHFWLLSKLYSCFWPLFIHDVPVNNQSGEVNSSRALSFCSSIKSITGVINIVASLMCLTANVHDTSNDLGILIWLVFLAHLSAYNYDGLIFVHPSIHFHPSVHLSLQSLKQCKLVLPYQAFIFGKQLWNVPWRGSSRISRHWGREWKLPYKLESLSHLTLKMSGNLLQCLLW